MREPGRSLDGTTGKDRPIGGTVAEGDLLPCTGEQHCVLADDVASPDDGIADLAIGTFAAAAGGVLGVRLRQAASLCRGLP